MERTVGRTYKSTSVKDSLQPVGMRPKQRVLSLNSDENKKKKNNKFLK